MYTADRRKEARFPTDEIAEMRFSRLGLGPTIEARVCDISKSGLRIEVSRQLPVGCKAAIQMGEVLISADVRRCRQIGPQSYEVGLRINEVKKQFKVKSWLPWRIGRTAPAPSRPASDPPNSAC